MHANTIAEQISEQFNHDGTNWIQDGVKLTSVLKNNATVLRNVAVTGSGKEWNVTAWVMMDGSMIAEVQTGAWDVLDRYTCTDGIYDLDCETVPSQPPSEISALIQAIEPVSRIGEAVVRDLTSGEAARLAL